MALNLFKDILPSIMVSKKSVLVEQHDQKDYSAFMVNRALSLHQDCLHQANQMNILSDLPKDAEYAYLMTTVRSRKRPFVPWPKQLKDDSIKAIQRHFNYSRQKAIAAIKILSEEQVEAIVKIYADLPK